jgi:antitoxin component YwqK of YwqJK toxin-antitoxin module
MKSIVTLLTICLAFAAQSQILKKTYHDYQKTKVQYVYYVNGSGQYNGLLTQYNYEGAKLGEETYINGIKNGAYKEYYTRGAVSKLKIAGTYKNDEKHGQWITYTYLKYGQSYFDIIQSMMFNDKEVDIFNTGVQTKVKDETFNNGSCTKETKYHLNGKVFFTANFENRRYIGDYVCYNDKSDVLYKGKIGPGGKMVGLWVVAREENGDSPSDKHAIGNVIYTQKIKFDESGNIDTNYMSKSYYLSNKLRDSVRLYSLEYTSGYNNSGIWYLCGKNVVIGKYKKYFESGKLMEEGQYRVNNDKSRQVGLWKYYDKDGTLKGEKDFDVLIRNEQIQDSISRDHTQKLEDWLNLSKKLALEYSKLTDIYTRFKTISKPYSGEFETIEDIGDYGNVESIYVFYKKQDLFKVIREITIYCLDSKDYPRIYIKNNFPKKLSDFTEIYLKSPDNYNKSIDKLNKLISLIPKMIACAENKTKELEKQLTIGVTIEEKIKIIENYQFEPK